MFRYDSSRLARFMTPDPLAGTIQDPQSLNRYAYVRNDPANLVDPLGLCLFCGGFFSRAPLSNTGDFEGGGGGGAVCYVDYAPMPCRSVWSLLQADAAVPCPNNNCEGIIATADGSIYQRQLVPRWQTDSHFGLTCSAAPGQPCTVAIGATAYQWAYVPVGTASDIDRAFPGYFGRGRNGDKLSPYARAVFAEAGRRAAPVADPTFIVGWYAASAVAGAAGAYAAGGATTEAVNAAVISTEASYPGIIWAAQQFFQGATVPGPPPPTLPGYLGSLIRYLGSKLF
jgi:hypothetical protein